jgi:hypothetical protein
MTGRSWSVRIRFRKLIVWSILFTFAVLAGALGFAYFYITDSSTLVELINARVPHFFPGSRFQVERVLLRPMLGQVDIRQATLWQTVDGRPFNVGRIPWLQVRCDLRSLWQGKLDPREVIVAQPTLRVTRRGDGTWNLEGFLADPWPQTPDLQPSIRISKGMLELVDGLRPAMILHDVELTLEPEARGVYRFEGHAQGDAFDRVSLAGIVRTSDGRIEMTRSELTGLTLTDSLRTRLPPEWLPTWDELGFKTGVLDVHVEHLRCGRSAAVPPSYAVRLTTHGASWSCARLPFPLSDLSASARIENGKLEVTWAEGRYGKTHVRIDHARLELGSGDPTEGPLELDVSISDLELDARIRDKLPPDLQIVWDDFTVGDTHELGRISLHARLERAAAGAPLTHAVTCDLQDVHISYKYFPFPLEHLHGSLLWVNDELTIPATPGVRTLVGGKPLTLSGVVRDLDGQTTVSLAITAESIPVDVDGHLVRALPQDLSRLVQSFHPTGTVRGSARVEGRAPSPEIGADPLAAMRVDAILDLNEGCSIRWDGFPYAVQRLTGRIELHPDRCVFTNMQGENGVARIAARGQVVMVRPGVLATDLTLHADRLPFDQELHDSLPPTWRATWSLLNPDGSSTLDARVVAGWPGRADRTWLNVQVAREDEARLKLRLLPVPSSPDAVAGRWIELPTMQDVRGSFVFDNGAVTMNSVAFEFREAHVACARGRLHLRDTGQFDLRLEDMNVTRLRFDSELRRIMPPRLAQFAQRLDEGKPLALRSNLSIAWSGRAEEPAVCAWDLGRVFFQDNSIVADVPIEHIQGQLVGLEGRSDGLSLSFAGALDIDSMIIAGQQVSSVKSPLSVSEGKAVLSDVYARFLDGELRGACEMSLESTPEYHAWAHLSGADLTRFTQTLPGRQDLTGKLSARVSVSGVGSDLRRLNGSGDAQLSNGDLGKLPWFVRLISPLNLSSGNKAAFDAADLQFMVKDGMFQLDPIKVTGNTISLYGRGSIDPQGEIDLELKPVYGRDEKLHIPVISDLTREASAQVFIITAQGPIASPRIGVPVFPGPRRTALGFVQRLGGLGESGPAASTTTPGGTPPRARR